MGDDHCTCGLSGLDWRGGGVGGGYLGGWEPPRPGLGYTHSSFGEGPNPHFTPRKIDIEPENNGFKDDFPFPGGPYSQVPC